MDRVSSDSGSAPAYGSNLIIMFMPGFWSAPTPVFFLESMEGWSFQTQFCISASIEIGEYVSGRDGFRKRDRRLDCAAKEVSRLVLTDAG